MEHMRALSSLQLAAAVTASNCCAMAIAVASARCSGCWPGATWSYSLFSHVCKRLGRWPSCSSMRSSCTPSSRTRLGGVVRSQSSRTRVGGVVRRVLANKTAEAESMAATEAVAEVVETPKDVADTAKAATICTSKLEMGCAPTPRLSSLSVASTLLLRRWPQPGVRSMPYASRLVLRMMHPSIWRGSTCCPRATAIQTKAARCVGS
mmetsp:Transcript_51796/g.134425  ORF Transcript_51796/g.134425 Transcript_51796/m.134425 type:complete len:207 (-) Transcript_51796:394-1014(-)